MGFSVLFRILLIGFASLLLNAFAYHYPSYQSCSPYTCNHSLIKYPFNNCGYTSAYCGENQSSLLFSFPSSQFCPEELYRVLGEITESTYTNRTIRVVCDSFPHNCSARTTNPLYTPYNDYYYSEDDYVWQGVGFSLSDKYKSGSVLICTNEPSYSNILQRIKCLECRSTRDLCYFLPSRLSPSKSDNSCVDRYGVIIPSNKSYNISDEKNLGEFLYTGFDVKWNNSAKYCSSCEASGGVCYGYDYPTTACICHDGPHEYNCSDGNVLDDHFDEETWWRKIWDMISEYKAVLGAISGVIIISIIIFIYGRISRKKREQQEEQDIRGYMDPLDSTPPSIENFLQAGIPTRYSYRQIKRYTKNFAMKLGQGGFGTVFKGELSNGCMVAIKTLDKSKHNQIQFLNEVATIGRIHHLHLVRLLGYCLEGSKRALIYEFMVNGSLEKYIHEDDQSVLNWKQLYSIAMGTARGIAYLHDECRNRILHCDIKPHNVLLDANFSPKVADFGLAKLTNREESHVSLTRARGTPGYVAPEVWSRSNGPVTDRSDVYSFGMLIMEIVGGRKNFDMKASRSSKFYYPEWAFKQVEMGEFRNLRGENIMDDEDEIIAKKLSMLGLWCIQYSPSHRPSMSRVIQMLEGTIDIVMPPQPFPVDTLVQNTSTESSSSM